MAATSRPGANFLLNVGPMPNGKIQSEFVERLRGIGGWLELYGDSIYNTRGGLIAPGPWGVSTAKQDVVYLHVLDWNERILALPSINRKIATARLLRNQALVPFEMNDDALLVTLPARPDGLIDEIVVLEMQSGQP